MINDFEILDPLEIGDNVFKLIGQDWMLITAGTVDSLNTMTASWGGMGVLWNKNVCFCVIRPTRYTYEFMEKSDNFTLCFFTEKYRDVLNFCGTHSGRDVDKIEMTGLTPLEGSNGIVFFDEARLVIETSKIYFQDLNPENFLDDSIDGNYPKKDYHRMYIGEIDRVLKKGLGFS
jgi:flavin reductase (DIM6/NTAB) family NADH-FMN oxidoreductase RutF